ATALRLLLAQKTGGSRHGRKHGSRGRSPSKSAVNSRTGGGRASSRAEFSNAVFQPQLTCGSRLPLCLLVLATKRNSGSLLKPVTLNPSTGPSIGTSPRLYWSDGAILSK